jgi:hypothetical protein
VPVVNKSSSVVRPRGDASWKMTSVQGLTRRPMVPRLPARSGCVY